jgi:hypothetical protein
MGFAPGVRSTTVRRRVVRLEEAQRMVHVRERRLDDLRGHEVREDLLHPHVVEPAHRHEVAEPHVRRLVRDEARAPELLRARRRLVEEQRVGAIPDRARMLHAAELERRHGEEVELAERVRDPVYSSSQASAPRRGDRRSRRDCA